MKTKVKKSRKKGPVCYVCQQLGLEHAGFEGYEKQHIQYDHWLSKGRIGGRQTDNPANKVPIHAHPEGLTYKDPGFEKTRYRNCHKGKGNKYTGQEWVQVVKIWRKILESGTDGLKYSDDLIPETKRTKIQLRWNSKDKKVHFLGDGYPLMVQKKPGSTEVWRSFTTLVENVYLWSDQEVQPRAIDRQRTADMAFHLTKSPLLTPILCRYSDNKLKVYDGNHRLCAFILAHPDQKVPVTIFEGPDPKEFLEVVKEAHDNFTQQKYQYSDKALKISVLSQDELDKVIRDNGNNATEILAWEGLTRVQVKERIIGKIIAELDKDGGYRIKWKNLGVTDKSWIDFIGMYVKTLPEESPILSDRYLREDELENMKFLCKTFDEILFSESYSEERKFFVKTKWWKIAHRRFRNRVSQLVMDNLELPETPKFPAYTKRWNEHIKAKIQHAAKKWVTAPVWRYRSTANNEPDVENHLNENGFTEQYLFSGRLTD